MPLYHCRKPRRQSDVTSLISALDTTLKMSDVSVDRESPDVETAAEKHDEAEPLDVPYYGKEFFFSVSSLASYPTPLCGAQITC